MDFLQSRKFALPPAGVMGLCGAWLVLAPWLLPGHFPAAAIVSDTLCGLAAAALAGAAVLFPRDSIAGWLGTAIGLWVLFAPWICRYDAIPAALASDTITAVMLLVGTNWAMLAATGQQK